MTARSIIPRKPEQRTERAGEHDSLHAREGEAPYGERAYFLVHSFWVFVLGHVFDRPVRLGFGGWVGYNGSEEFVLFLFGARELGDHKRIDLAVDVFNGCLERVEAPGFRELYFGGKPREEVLNNDAVGGGKESQDLQDEVLLAGFQ